METGLSEEVMPTSDMKCEVMGQMIRLHQDGSVFKPNLTTAVLTEQVDKRSLLGATALDLGCGSGPIAIALALNGARHVYAVDLMPRACAVATMNAAINGVADKVTVLQGDLFEPVHDIGFDLIIDDVSGVAKDVAELSSWFPNSVPTGGPDGTDQVVRMLRQAPALLKSSGYLLFPVLGLSRRTKILETAASVFGRNLQRIATRTVPFNHELRANLPRLETLREAGIIEYGQVRSRYYWTLEIYRAWIRRHAGPNMRETNGTANPD